MQGSKIDYSKLVYRSSYNEHFDYTTFAPLSSFYWKLINENIGINVAKLSINEFKADIDKLKRNQAKKRSYKTNKRDVLENAKTLYNILNITIEALENRIFERKYRPEIDVDYDLNNAPESDLLLTSDHESHGLTDKELQMFRKTFTYKNPQELRQALIEATDEKYNELLNDFNIKLTALKD